MKEAVAFGRLAKVDPALRELYEPIAQQKESSIYQVALQAYLKKASRKLPSLANDQAKLTAPDDSGPADADLDVKIVAQDGTPIESCKAVEIGVRSGKWAYAITQPIGRGTVIFIETRCQALP
jgi:hypothetical protein